MSSKQIDHRELTRYEHDSPFLQNKKQQDGDMPVSLLFVLQI
ncbi:hypothetical protein [Brevibacillus fluminis]|nr:hypothetical protein [Brevibacillus fluminis]